MLSLILPHYLFKTILREGPARDPEEGLGSVSAVSFTV